MHKIADAAGRYGPGWVTGVLLEHIAALRGAGTVFLRYDARGFASVRQGTDVLPVLCGEIIEIPTEDGAISGRCGGPVHRDQVHTYGSCPGHAEERAHWERMTEWERAQWELAND